MKTIKEIEAHAAAIIAKGAPFTKDELFVVELVNKLHGGKAFNAGRRNDKHFQQTGK